MKTSEAGLLEARAVRYFDAARVLHANETVPHQSYWEPLNHLLGMAAELALKAFLMRSDAPSVLLKKHDVRHNLLRLIREAISQGLRTTEDVAVPLIHMSKAHADHSFRYTGPLKADRATVIFAARADAAITSIGDLIDHASPNPMSLRGHIGSGQEWILALPAIQPLTDRALQALVDQVDHYQQRITAGGPPTSS